MHQKNYDDKEIVLDAVKNYGCAIKFISYKLKCDKDIVFAAVKNNGTALKHVSKCKLNLILLYATSNYGSSNDFRQ
jgi:hypothetical protein